MDLTLRDYLHKADEIHRIFQLNSSYLHIDDIYDNLKNLELYIKQIQSISYRIANIYNDCKKRLPTAPTSMQVIVTPSKDDWVNMAKQKIPKNLYKDRISQIVAPNIKINVKIANEMTDIPNTDLYWVKSINQFAFKINGITMRGNIGNIFIRNEKYEKIHKCTYGAKCTNDECPHFHDPLEIYKLKNKNEFHKDIQNFIGSSWLYTPHIKSRKSKHMRYIGNRDTLKNEIEMLQFYNSKKNDITLYKNQTMHDLLVLMAIGQFENV